MVGVTEKLVVWDGRQHMIIFQSERQLYGEKVGELLAEGYVPPYSSLMKYIFKLKMPLFKL